MLLETMIIFVKKKMILVEEKPGTISKESHKESFSHCIMRVEDINSNSKGIYGKVDLVYNELYIN